MDFERQMLVDRKIFTSLAISMIMESSPALPPAPITAVIPSTGDRDILFHALDVIRDCRPGVAEVIVHLDAAPPGVAEKIRKLHPEVRVISSPMRQGPGGARNKLIMAASNELVANFDDDSFPELPDYFSRIMLAASLFPKAAIISAASQESEKQMPGYHKIAVASGCGCVFRKSWFERTRGFVPLEIAYGMEEVDISLQVHALGGGIILDPGLHVKHDKEPPMNVSAKLNAAVIANFALLAYLRYPYLWWPVGLWQIVRRCLFGLGKGWSAGTLMGLRMIPSHLGHHRRYRSLVSSQSLFSWLWLKQRPVKLGAENQAVPSSLKKSL